MGFGEKWIGWIVECVFTTRAAVLMNGSTKNEFRLCRGLRQGDQLFLYLFIFVTEVLHLLLVKVKEEGLITGIHYVIPDQSFSHLQFTDDTILFLKAEEEVVHNVKHILRCFESFLGLSINF